jgi:hypothetical protein
MPKQKKKKEKKNRCTYFLMHYWFRPRCPGNEFCCTHRITGVSDFIHRPDFNNYKKKETRRFGNWMFPSSGEGRTPILLGNRSSFRNVVFFLFLVIIKIRTMDKVRNPSNSVCYTPSSEPYRIYLNSVVVRYNTAAC